MGKEVKLERVHEVEDAKVVEEGNGQPSKDELKKQLSQEEINVENSKALRKQLKGINHNDLVGFILLFNDHEKGKVGVFSSLDQSVSQFVALAHGGYVDQYDQIINQIITTRTIERMRGVQTPPPGVKKQDGEQEAGEGQVPEDTSETGQV